MGGIPCRLPLHPAVLPHPPRWEETQSPRRSACIWRGVWRQRPPLASSAGCRPPEVGPARRPYDRWRRSLTGTTEGLPNLPCSFILVFLCITIC